MGILCVKENWRSNFMSRNEVFSVIWSRCAVFLQNKGYHRILSMIEQPQDTGWRLQLGQCSITARF